MQHGCYTDRLSGKLSSDLGKAVSMYFAISFCSVSFSFCGLFETVKTMNLRKVVRA